MPLYVCLYLKYKNHCSTVSKFNVPKTDLRFDRVMLLMVRKQKLVEKIKCCNTWIFFTFIKVVVRPMTSANQGVRY